MGSLFTRRAIAFLLALLLAIVAVAAVLNYVRGVEEQVADEADLVEGYVATQRIEVGTLADTAIQLGAIVQRDIPRDLLAADAVTSLTQITSRAVQEVILPGDQIISGRFAAPGQAVEVLTIPPDHQAMSVEVEIPPGVAGFLREGDFVSIIAYIETVQQSDEPVAPSTDAPQAQADLPVETRAQYVLQDVEVLAVGRRVAPSEENPAGGTADSGTTVLLTVAVTPDEAEKLTFGTLAGELWVTLLPEDEREPVETTGRTFENVFDE